MKIKFDKNYFFSIAVLIGTVTGAGIFAAPYVISKSGILSLFIYVPILAFVQYYLHLLYAEIILSTKTKHRMPGYVGIYFGEKYKKYALVASLIGRHGALLAYIVLGGIFLHGLLGPVFGGSVFIYASLLFLFQAAIVFTGIKAIASLEFFMSIVLILVVALIGYKSSAFFSWENYSLINWRYALLPYGVLFFSVGGQAAIPEICSLLENNQRKIKSAITWGTFIPAVIMMVFVVIVVGVTGTNTSPDTLIGLRQVFQNGIVTFAMIFGLLSVITSYLVISQSMREMYWWDMGLNKNLAWFLACFIPFFLYLVGLRDLTGIISITGSIMGGIFGVILILTIIKVKSKRQLKPVFEIFMNKPIAIVLSSMFVLGLIYELYYYIAN